MIATGRFYLNRTHFMAMLGAAFAVHLLVGVAWVLMPSVKVNQIPVHVLNIKLGAGDVSTMTALSPMDAPEATTARAAAQPVPVPPPHENARVASPPAVKPVPAKKEAVPVEKKVTTKAPAAQKQGKANEAQSVANTGSATTAPLASNATPSQYVRRSGAAQGIGLGSAVGNSVDPQAEVMRRYTQLISMWINRQKSILNRALKPGMKGNIVIRLRIDRQGNVVQFKLDKATGVPMVDAAAADMIRAANPVPPVPSNYPGGNMFEFLIPVGYTFQQ